MKGMTTVHSKTSDQVKSHLQEEDLDTQNEKEKVKTMKNLKVGGQASLDRMTKPDHREVL